MDEINLGSYPRNLAYSIKYYRNFSKQTIRLNVDKPNGVGPDETVKIRFPQNTIMDNRTFSVYFKGTATCGDLSTTNIITPAVVGPPAIPAVYSMIQAHFPRNSSSLIDTLNVYVNNRILDSIPNYNHIYNALSDLNGSDCAQTSKRNILENADPSVIYLLLIIHKLKVIIK